MPDTWLDLANESRVAAKLLVRSNHRSAVSRAYYAVFAKVSQELAQVGAPMPAGWDAPNHKKISPMIRSFLTGKSLPQRKALSRAVVQLYTLRIDADYRLTATVGAREARHALALMKTIFEAF